MFIMASMALNTSVLPAIAVGSGVTGQLKGAGHSLHCLSHTCNHLAVLWQRQETLRLLANVSWQTFRCMTHRMRHSCHVTNCCRSPQAHMWFTCTITARETGGACCFVCKQLSRGRCSCKPSYYASPDNASSSSSSSSSPTSSSSGRCRFAVLAVVVGAGVGCGAGFCFGVAFAFALAVGFCDSSRRDATNLGS